MYAAPHCTTDHLHVATGQRLHVARGQRLHVFLSFSFSLMVSTQRASFRLHSLRRDPDAKLEFAWIVYIVNERMLAKTSGSTQSLCPHVLPASRESLARTGRRAEGVHAVFLPAELHVLLMREPSKVAPLDVTHLADSEQCLSKFLESISLQTSTLSLLEVCPAAPLGVLQQIAA